jgi:phosphoribosylformylglycinamidine synthase subunit PurS
MNTKMKARVYVTMKPSVLDAQGQAVRTALQSMGHSMVQDVRQGKYFELDLNATDRAAAATELEQISHDILSNPVIEQYRVEIVD